MRLFDTADHYNKGRLRQEVKSSGRADVLVGNRSTGRMLRLPTRTSAFPGSAATSSLLPSALSLLPYYLLFTS